MFPKNYVPTLAIRPSEMKGLEFLPGKIKDQITPCILLAPWAGISPLNRAIKRVERAFPGRNYFLDIDRNYQYSNLEGQAQQELLCLSDSANWTKWIEFIKKNEHVFPCIQFKHRNENTRTQPLDIFPNAKFQKIRVHFFDSAYVFEDSSNHPVEYFIYSSC